MERKKLEDELAEKIRAIESKEEEIVTLKEKTKKLEIEREQIIFERLDKIEKETTTTETSSRKGKDKIVEPEEDNMNENKKLAMASQGTELIMTANKQFFPP
ncbi:hypothetical protein RhiirA5_422783 [Rhizophagus irregularis]|uniref:Uncharacterized protein n=1 Tax=Rhizophagus irregularis TaxID=588596 RepID=A0A2N0PB71_9GLOM|nr:hypothetical protein RhiirA5_422783 [Rhizophagus irregularis]